MGRGAKDLNLGIVDIYMVFKAMRLNEITNKMSIDRNKQTIKLGLSNIKRSVKIKEKENYKDQH